jgi:hypothetical protein
MENDGLVCADSPPRAGDRGLLNIETIDATGRPHAGSEEKGIMPIADCGVDGAVPGMEPLFHEELRDFGRSGKAHDDEG